ncbi:hypothetical protein QEV83_00150 [Methylocapsa sp. D3K7]|uniref:hypothetical protein n=1 Tax=Methylocapsa sp. D3K7 TaxID=3041435 RepID=UPI00244EC7AA|nr:hypothetical protein [Methylocapsa sp. D3K7]WGJ14774.1 hypothetical protein QEV83_00150 [Methylocapsa sp. D3K7]
MADKLSYPQIPSTVWWGLRNVLQRSPSATIDERALGVELNVQETAARQYLSELKRVGILNDENKATPVAQKWRDDETYGEAVDEILRNAYPESLIQVAPRGAADRQKIISWFTREGLGSGTAGNKAATYLLISSDLPNEAPSRGSARPQKVAGKGSQMAQAPARAAARSSSKGNEKRSPPPLSGLMPLNVNVQIHISAEATGEQIESIFAAMRRYLYDGTGN